MRGLIIPLTTSQYIFTQISLVYNCYYYTNILLRKWVLEFSRPDQIYNDKEIVLAKILKAKYITAKSTMKDIII